MTFAFDLISDLHLETWSDLDWTDQATAPFCVIAGDVCRDHANLGDFLHHISNQYRAVFYIDGNDEHRFFYHDLTTSFKNIEDITAEIPDVIYLQDNLIVIDGVAIIGTNGWWDYNFDSMIDLNQSIQWCAERYNIRVEEAERMVLLGHQDSRYLIESVQKLQRHNDVKKIVIVTHTVPCPKLVNHDLDIINTYRMNTMGTSVITACLDSDTENKISTWCFGHYHNDVDMLYNNVRWVNNPRGRGDTRWGKSVYFPKRIQIET